MFNLEAIAGVFYGVAVTISGHPIEQYLFSTIKVRMQVGEVTSVLSCVKRTFLVDGIKGFYLGVTSPLISYPLVNTVLFGAYGQAKRALGNQQNIKTAFLAGAYAGLLNTVILTPVELIKCKMQSQSLDLGIGKATSFEGAFRCGLQVIKQEGFQSIYKGNVANIYREVPGCAIMFGCFQVSKILFKKILQKEELPKWALFVSGMFGGLQAWFWSYPQDLVKTKIQVGVDYPLRQSWDGGFREISYRVYQEYGIRGFYKGFSACCVRATLPNGFGFLAYEWIMRLNKKEK